MEDFILVTIMLRDDVGSWKANRNYDLCNGRHKQHCGKGGWQASRIVSDN